MACANIFQALKMVSESLGKDVHRKALNKSVWMNAVPKGVYPLGKGLTQTTFTIENSMPTNDELAWERIEQTAASGVAGIDTAASGLCQPDWQDVEWGFSEQTYSPERIAIRGPQICQSNLKYRYNVDVFMRAYLEEITKHSKRVLENKIQNEYMKHARKVTISGTSGSEALVDTEVIGDGDTDMKDLTAATDLANSVKLLPGHLDQLAIKLIESGATEGDSNGWIELGANGPVFPLIIGMEQSNLLLKADDNVRTDYRESSKSNELLARLGADRVTGNFRHIVVTNPVRLARNSGNDGYDRVSENSALGSGELTKGSGTKLNPLYVSAGSESGAATHEAAIALTPSVMKQLVVPSTTPGGLAFSPENYSGDWQFVTGGYRITEDAQCNDPLEVYGRHYGQYEMAFEPVFGDHGATLIYKRNGAA
jgi:hypothetical protein